MSKITKTALRIWSSQTNILDFLFGETPSNRWANLLLFSVDSENLSTSLDKVKRNVMTIIVIHPMNANNAIIVEIILLTPEKLN